MNPINDAIVTRPDEMRLARIARTECVDVGHCYRCLYIRSVVRLAVCLCAGHDREPRKAVEPIEILGGGTV